MIQYSILLLQALAQIKVYHWQTLSFAQHEALGELYDALTPLVDKFVECFIGRYGRGQNGTTASLGVTFEPSSAFDMLNELEAALIGMALPDSDLLNIRDEMTAEIKQAKYRLTLN